MRLLSRNNIKREPDLTLRVWRCLSQQDYFFLKSAENMVTRQIQHPNLDLGGNRVLGRFTMVLTVGSALSKASGSDTKWYLGAIAGN